MNFKELQERAKGRNFDQITVVSRDIFQELANLSWYFPLPLGRYAPRRNRTILD